MGFVVLLGNTYQYKETLKRNEWRFNFDNKVWFKNNIDVENSSVIINNAKSYFKGIDACYLESMDDFKEYEEILKEDTNKVTKIESSFTNKVVEVTKWYSKIFKENNNTNFIFRNFKILNVYVETAKAIQVDLEFFGGVASCCGVCGRSLDNSVSIATGIGPICASKLGLPRPTMENAKDIIKQMEELSKNQGVFEKVWIPKSQIKKVL